MKVRTDMDTIMGLHSPARFRVEPDTARGVTYITLSGFFLLPDVAAFDREWAQAHALLRCAPNAHLTLCDISDMSIQSQDVVNAFTTIVRDPVRQGRRLAMVVGMSLSRHQAKRLNPPDREGVAHFFSRAEAEAWLFSDDRTDAQYRHAPASPMSADHGYIGPSAA